MNIKRCCATLFIFILLLWNWNVSVFGMNTGFSTNEMNLEDRQTFLSNFKLSLVTDEPQKKTIVCFDVSDSGLIAIGSKTSANDLISVYDTTGKFQYGYSFNAEQSFGVQWNGENLIIYLVRSDVAALFNEKGVVLELRCIEDTTENNSYWNQYVFSEEKTAHQIKYTMKNDMGLFNLFASSYSQLIQMDSSGNETIIYDVNTMHATQSGFIFIVVCLFAVAIIAIVVWQILKTKKQ